MNGIILAIHGGAGAVERGKLDPGCEDACRKALCDALLSAFTILDQNGSALDAVERAVILLEDFAEFNAGRGSVLNAAGGVEMDAAIMDGSGKRAGAVAAVRTTMNPIRAARAVLDHSSHVLLVGAAADRFAAEQGAEIAPKDYFITPQRREHYEQALHQEKVTMDQHGLGTVGAVARDARGHLAAATSTGGMTNKSPGRVGDSPIIGAGTWADNATCAVSATGNGEAFLRTVFAHEVDALMRHGGRDLHAACSQALTTVHDIGHSGGCIAIAATGNAALCFNTKGMYRGWIGQDGRAHVAIFGDEMVVV